VEIIDRGCQAISACRYVSPGIASSLSSVGQWGWLLFPNPTDGVVYISPPAKGWRVRVLSLLGEEVIPWYTAESSSIFLKDLPAGMYLIQLELDGRQGWQRVWLTK